MSARWAKVVAVHPEAHAADLVFLDTGARVPMVTVLCDTVSTNTGDLDLPEPTPGLTDYSHVQTKDRDVYAAVVFVGGLPAIIGFKVPEICQMTFKRKNFKVYRHASDLYWTVNDAGDFELFHPSGTFLRIATTAAHEDLTGQDFDKRWAITRNTAAAVHVALVVKDAGVQKASLDIAPTGDISLVTVGTITSQAAAWNHTGDVNVTGTVTATVDVIGGGKHLKTHTHSGVTVGSGTTGAPS